MRSWFALFIGLMVSAIALAASFALANMAAAFATGVGAPLAAGAGSLLGLSGIAAFIGGAGMIASLIGGVSLVSGGVSAMKPADSSDSGSSSSSAPPEFAHGGIVKTQQAIVHPGELILTGGQGSEVLSPGDLRDLVKLLKGEGGDVINRIPSIAVYIGEKQVTDIVLKAIDSPKGKRMFGTYAR